MEKEETLDQLCERFSAVKALREENERFKQGFAKTCEVENILNQEIIALESQLAGLRQGGEAVWFHHIDKDGMDVFMNTPFGLEDETPLFTRPQPAIPPGYAVVPETAPLYLPAYGTYDFEWLKWAVGEARGNPVEWDESYFVGHHPAHVNNLNSLNRIVTAAVQHALTAAPSVPVAEKWQPIETAPKDGTAILVSFGCMGVWRVHWEDPHGDSEEYALWCVDENKHGPFALRGYIDEPGSKTRPTHWMPLPAAPADSKEGE